LRHSERHGFENLDLHTAASAGWVQENVATREEECRISDLTNELRDRHREEVTQKPVRIPSRYQQARIGDTTMDFGPKLFYKFSETVVGQPEVSSVSSTVLLKQ
jgi:hypothetical protein